MHCLRLLIAATMFAATWSVSASAQAPSLSGADWITLRLQSFARAGKPVDDARTRMLGLFANSDMDGGGVSKSDYELHDQLLMAQQRAGVISPWMQRDLDGDGIITRTELEGFYGKQARRPIRSSGVTLTPTEDQVKQMLTKLVGSAMAVDANGDQKVTFGELRAAAAEQANKRQRSGYRANALVPLTLDTNGNAAVSNEEYIQAVERALGTADADGDGQFSDNEVAALRGRAKELHKIERARAKELQKIERARKTTLQSQARSRQLTEACGFPAAPKGAKVVLLGTYAGEALSTVRLGDSAEQVTVANVWVEPGTKPLYVVLAAQGAMIWQFTGNVGRVAQVVAGSSRMIADGIPRAGIVGLPRDRTYFAPQQDCLPFFYKPNSTRAANIQNILLQSAGLKSDVVIGRSGISTVSVPSGIFDRQAAYDKTMDLPATGPAKELWAEVRRSRPGGIVRVDAKAVVSRAPVKPYDILPGKAGLAQLVESGALKITGTQKIIRVIGTQTQVVLGTGSDTIMLPEGEGVELAKVPSRFRILEKIRLPAGLSGRHSARFVLAPNVPKPDGITAQSCVIDETTGKPISPGRGCR